MPASLLDLDHAYDDEPMFRQPLHLTESARSIPRPPTSPPLVLSDRLSHFEDYGIERMRSPLRLPAPSTPFQPRTPPPKYSSRQDPEQSDTFPANPRTPYEVLGVSEYATQEDIKKAYKNLALAHHPDRCHGTEAEVEEATRRFKLIAEAYAILGIPERRAEFNISRRDRSRDRPAAPYASNAGPTFKSTFMPSKPAKYSSWGDEEEEDPTLQDLRYLDPFSLFSSMFPQFDKQFTDNLRESGRRFGRKDDVHGRGDFVPSDNISRLLNDPLMSGTSMNGRKDKSEQFRTVTEREEKAHMNRHGHLKFSKNERTMKVHKSGGFTYSSSSFSGSFGTGSGNMLAAMMSGGMSFGGGNNVSGLGSSGMQSMLGTPDWGSGLPPPRSRSRRPSFGALEDDSRALAGPSLSASRSLARRPSFSNSDPFDSRPSVPDFGNDDLSLASYNGAGGSLERYGGW